MGSESFRAVSVRFMAAMATWLVLASVIGLVAGIAGMGTVGITGGILLGVCGMAAHLVLWGMGREPHWSYAGLVFGALPILVIMFIDRSQPVDAVGTFMMFLAFSAIYYCIYPVAKIVLNAPARH